jgi:hypothetical protein
MRRGKFMRFVYGIGVGVVALLPAGLCAQQKSTESPEFDVAITYNVQRSNLTSGEDFWAHGGSAELTATFYHGLGMAANVTGTHAANISSSGVGLTLVTATFGPTYTWAVPPHGNSPTQWRVFGESLIGIANGVGSVFPGSLGAQSDGSGLALQIGGGADLDLSTHLAVQLFHADWLRTQLPNGNANVQNNLQLAAGIVFRFPR